MNRTLLSFSQRVACHDWKWRSRPDAVYTLRFPDGEHVPRRTRLAQDRSSRPVFFPSQRESKRSPGRRRRSGLRLLSWLIWLIPLGLLAAAGVYGYRQYDQMRSRPGVTRGLVQPMTSGEAEKLLSAKGYLKSRYQAMIGTKIAGRVEQMCVEEGMKVKKGDTLAVIEHNDLKAMLASREAQALRTAAELEEAQADLWEKEREDRRVTRLYRPEERHSGGIRESRSPGTRRRPRGSRPSKPPSS